MSSDVYADRVYHHLEHQGWQACIQIAVGLGLPLSHVRTSLETLIQEGKVCRYELPRHLQCVKERDPSIFLYGIPQPLSLKDLVLKLFSP